MKGTSPWKRGVRAGVQVLVCPPCQVRGDWMTDLDRCQECGSTMLVRLLGETQCRACGESRPESAAPHRAGRAPGVAEGATGLADEVEAALDRFFGRA